MNPNNNPVRVKVFQTPPVELEETMNAWLADHPEAAIRDMRVFQIEKEGPLPEILCLLFYSEPVETGPRRAGFRGLMGTTTSERKEDTDGRD